MYALSLGADGRVLSATLPAFAPSGATLVDELPEGDISDYRYVEGQFVLEALPLAAAPSDPMDDMAELLLELNDRLMAVELGGGA